MADFGFSALSGEIVRHPHDVKRAEKGSLIRVNAEGLEKVLGADSDRIVRTLKQVDRIPRAWGTMSPDVRWDVSDRQAWFPANVSPETPFEHLTTFFSEYQQFLDEKPEESDSFEGFGWIHTSTDSADDKLEIPKDREHYVSPNADRDWSDEEAYLEEERLLYEEHARTAAASDRSETSDALYLSANDTMRHARAATALSTCTTLLCKVSMRVLEVKKGYEDYLPNGGAGEHWETGG